MRKKRVLLLSEGFGTGHTQAAHALANGMKILHPHLQCRVLELGNFLNPTIGPWILSAYRKTINTSPAIIGMFYRNKYEKSLNRLTQLALHRIFYTHAAQVISQLKPDVIICTHPIPNNVIARLRKQGIDVPLITLITDYDVHGAWISPEVSHYLASSPSVKRLLIKRGVEPDKIQTTGIPVHPDFWKIGDKNQLRTELKLRNMPTVLIMSGGWGLNLKPELLRQLTSWADRIQLIFCTGSNIKLQEKMEENSMFDHPHITILGYTHQINKLMDVSDLLITKPGGMTCTEGLAKGIQMLFHEAIPGQEEQNSRFFVDHGFAETIDSPDVIEKWFHLITAHYEQFEARRQQPSRVEPYLQPYYCAQTVLNMVIEQPHAPTAWTATNP